MASTQNRLLGFLFVSGLLSCGLGACSSDTDNGSGSTGGSGGNGSGSVSSAGGGSSSVASSSNAGSSGGGQSSSSSSSKGGASGGSSSSQPASSGGVATGGSSSSEVASSGGSTSTGTGTGTGGKGGGTGTGTGTGGKGGSTGTGTSTGTGGKGGGTGTGTGTGTGGKGGNTDTGGTSAAGGTSAGGAAGGCQKGGFKGSELVIFGESFYDYDPHYIQLRIEEKAKAAGSLKSSETYRNVSRSGQPMSYIANDEYTAAANGGKFTKVVMDGGGIDCMNSSCPTCPDTFKGLLDKFVKEGVDQVIYTRYPEPGNPPGSNANLKKNLDALMPKMEEVCKAATGLKCYWVDLRPLWPAERDKYTTDGLHPTKTGGDVVGDAIWAEMVKQCMAQ